MTDQPIMVFLIFLICVAYQTPSLCNLGMRTNYVKCSSLPFLQQPCFIRYPRGHGTGVDLSPQPKSLEIGHAQIITKGNDGAIWALGNFVEEASWLSETLKEKFDLDCTVVNARFVKPLDEKLLVQHAKEHQFIISMEDNVLNGGFGSAMLEKLQENNISIPFKRIGWPDEFIPHGDSVSSLREKFRTQQDWDS